MSTKEIGNAGEEQARLFLTSKGYQILSRNYAAQGGEIDIVAQDGKTLVFVEVKKRASNAFGGPVSAITPAKQLKIARTAVLYLKEKKPKFDSIRFDAVCILPGHIEHIQNAFTPERMNL